MPGPVPLRHDTFFHVIHVGVHEFVIKASSAISANGFIFVWLAQEFFLVGGAAAVEFGERAYPCRADTPVNATVVGIAPFVYRASSVISLPARCMIPAGKVLPDLRNFVGTTHLYFDSPGYLLENGSRVLRMRTDSKRESWTFI